jgi:hypothetical protein
VFNNVSVVNWQNEVIDCFMLLVLSSGKSQKLVKQ